MVTGTVSRGQTRCPVTDQERLTSNPQLSTFNGVTERAMVAAIWGQTRNLGDRTLNPVDLTERWSGGPSWLWCPDLGTDTQFRACRDQIWGQTHNLSNRTFGPLDLTRRLPDGPRRLWRADMGTDTIFDIPIRNVQRPTFNAQL